MDLYWDGITQPEGLVEWAAAVRRKPADATKAYRRPEAVAIMSEHPELVNACRPGCKSRCAPLHQAAQVQRLPR